MAFKLERIKHNPTCIIGRLSLNGHNICNTLEDIARPEKIMHETCIPLGTYEIRLTFSNRFQTILPILIDVPNFEGIRIHSGNTSSDTSGCILVGFYPTDSAVYHSKEAMARVMNYIRGHLRRNGKAYISIVDKPAKKI